MLRNRQQFRAASSFLRLKVMSQGLPAPKTRWGGAPLRPIPPVAWHLGTVHKTLVQKPQFEQPLALFIQRKKIMNLNFAGQEKEENKVNGATRRILNIDALEKIAQGFGYATKVVDPAEMTLRAQIEMMQQASIFTAVFGSGWSNVVWMRRTEDTTAIMLLGWGFWR